MSKKVAVVLSGCGFKDGAEIHEAVLTLLALSQAGAVTKAYAPNIPQKTVTNHLTGEAMGETRNVLVESARIVRGDISDLKNLKASDADALIFPGGFGAALNLSDFAVKGPSCSVNPEVERVVKEFHAAGKPIGAICIAPGFVAKVLGSTTVRAQQAAPLLLTIGKDAGTAQALEACGAQHQNTAVHEICVDEANKVVSTSAYMMAENIAEAETGITKLVQKILEMA